ncbi:MAG TPA: sulfite exporter TauE/SafE family protein [Thermoanaerobaculia bacterium]|nr:sulfite exporter TauE/SafE family protein [Thermoanaerobaculia bacterium]
MTPFHAAHFAPLQAFAPLHAIRFTPLAAIRFTPLAAIPFTPLAAAILFLAAIVASAIGAMAGGSTLITFPALVLLGLPSVVANATSTVGMLPTGAGAMVGHFEDVRKHPRWLSALLLPGLAGGAIGSALLIATPERDFARIAPYLVLFATSLFIVQGALTFRRVSAVPRPPGRVRILVVGAMLFAVAVYDGYFGAGSGILMLALLGFLGLSDIHTANGLKGFFVTVINVVASAYFIARGAVHWPSVAVMVAGSAIGGYGGARFARRIGRGPARWTVIAIGLTMTVVLLARGRKL